MDLLINPVNLQGLAMSKYFILYDGRAEFCDTEDAVVMEAIGTKEREVSRALHNWAGFDCYLCSYDEDADGNLSNEEKLGHLRMGRKNLMSVCFQNKPLPEQSK